LQQVIRGRYFTTKITILACPKKRAFRPFHYLRITWLRKVSDLAVVWKGLRPLITRLETGKHVRKAGDLAEHKNLFPKSFFLLLSLQNIIFVYMAQKEGYIIRDQEKVHFITCTVVDWVDVFSRKAYKDSIMNSLEFCIKNKGMILYGYVIMTNHIHLIIQSENGKLSDLVRDFKKFTARIILDKIQDGPESRSDWMLKRFEFACKSHTRNEKYQFWQYGNHAEEIYSSKFLWSKLDYIHLNPVRAGIVEKASNYIYSSASNYVNDTGIIEITLVDNPIIDTLNFTSFVKGLQW
jgi:REP element-mobilizing transposase RayT